MNDSRKMSAERVDLIDIVIEQCLKTGAIRFNLKDSPVDQYERPINTDINLLLGDKYSRECVEELLIDVIAHDIPSYASQSFAGVSSVGISLARMLAGTYKKPFYIISLPEGTSRRVNGKAVPLDGDNEHYKYTLFMEGAISTGENAMKTVKGINYARDGRTCCNMCLTLFNYNMKWPKDMFEGKEQFDMDGSKLENPCEVITAVPYFRLIENAKKYGYIKLRHIETLDRWISNPELWDAEYRGNIRRNSVKSSVEDKNIIHAPSEKIISETEYIPAK